MMPFYSLVPPQSKFPDLSGHAWVPMDDNHTLCIFFSYHPSEPLPARTRELFEEGHNGRETGHPSRHAFVKRNATVPYADYWTRFTRETGFEFDYQSQVDTWFSGLPGLWIQDGACQSGITPDLRPDQGASRFQRYRHRHDPAAAAGSRQRLSRPRHQAERGDQSRYLHGSRGLAHAAGKHIMGRFRSSAHGCEARCRLSAMRRSARLAKEARGDRKSDLEWRL